MANIIFSLTNYQTLKDVFVPLRLERREKQKNVKKIEKVACFVKRNVKFVMLKCGNHSTTTRKNMQIAFIKPLRRLLGTKG